MTDTATVGLSTMSDDELALRVEDGWERYRAILVELAPTVVEQGRRLLVTCLPAEARFVEFYAEQWDNGLFLEFGAMYTEDRRPLGHFVDLRTVTPEQEAALSAFGADLIVLWGTDAAGIDLVTGEQVAAAAEG